jgi:glutamine synthetase
MGKPTRKPTRKPTAKPMTREAVLEAASDQNVQFVRLWFTDVLGMLKSVEITVDQLEGVLAEGAGFDGSSVEGYARIEESDMIAMPDPSTFAILPWRSKDGSAVARMFCDVLTPEGEHYAGDPRWALRRNLERASKMGYSFYVGPELEFFYFKNSKGTEFMDEGGYFGLTTMDVDRNPRRDTVFALQEMGIRVECSHHEVAPSQQEIDLHYSDALAMADAAMTCRLVAKEVAQLHGMYATFMPKPLFGQNGSGMHVHQSLFKQEKEEKKGGRNAFFDPKDEYHLSKTGKSYIAGLLRHTREICLVVAQWVNSYKRLVPGYEAPVYVAWGRRNRSSLVRVPMYKPGKEKATRAEFRCPDPACNPYLAFAVMLAAGLEGIEKGYEIPEPVEEDIYEMRPAERLKRGIQTLPGSLADAVAATEKSAFVREALGDHIFEKFIANKKIECDRYRVHVSRYEIENYLPVL